MEYGKRVLQRGAEGPDVTELQIRLAGFAGGGPDGDFGPGTERQVIAFQRDFMKMPKPTGIVARATFSAIDRLADKYPFDFKKLKCPCGKCGGFGRGKFKGQYRAGTAQDEKSYLYEYPGMHRMLLWAVRGVYHYLSEHKLTISSGYRCSQNNAQHGRTSTNHHGKAIDLDIVLERGECNFDDQAKCNKARERIVATGNAQIGWAQENRKALEPSDVAPTWVHYDVRCYERKYLGDEMFCTTLKGLDNRKPIKI